MLNNSPSFIPVVYIPVNIDYIIIYISLIETKTFLWLGKFVKQKPNQNTSFNPRLTNALALTMLVTSTLRATKLIRVVPETSLGSVGEAAATKPPHLLLWRQRVRGRCKPLPTTLAFCWGTLTPSQDTTAIAPNSLRECFRDGHVQREEEITPLPHGVE